MLMALRMPLRGGFLTRFTSIAQPMEPSLLNKMDLCGLRISQVRETSSSYHKERVHEMETFAKDNITKKPTSTSDLFQTCAIGACAGLVLGICNSECESYADKHPDSVLARDVGDGVGWRVANYVVPVSVTAGGVALWLTAQCTVFGRCSMWWFGSRRHWVSTFLCSLTIGHYAQEVCVNKWSGHAFVAHHIGAMAHAMCLLRVNAWRGLLMAWGGLYEVGSVLLNFGNLGYLPKTIGHCSVAATTSIGMALGMRSLARHRPSFGLNGAARFCVTALLCIGAGRIHGTFQESSIGV